MEICEYNQIALDHARFCEGLHNLDYGEVSVGSKLEQNFMMWMMMTLHLCLLLMLKWVATNKVVMSVMVDVEYLTEGLPNHLDERRDSVINPLTGSPIQLGLRGYTRRQRYYNIENKNGR